MGITAQKAIAKGARTHKVATAEFVDEKGGKIEVGVWNDAYALFEPLKFGVGVVIIGCNAANEQGEVKLSIWPYTVVCTDGDQAQSLTSFDASNLGTQTLTATFTPGQGLESLVECEAHPTCAKALADASGQVDAKVFQMNRVLVDVPLQQEAILTQDGRLFVKSCRVRDRTGGVDVDIVSGAIPALYGCANESELRQQFGAQSLTSSKERMNVRGVLRVEAGITKRYIVKAEPSSLEAKVSMLGMQQSLGLSIVSDDLVLPAPAQFVVDEPMLGLAVRRENAESLGVFRVLFLVQGQESTHMEVIDESVPMKDQVFKLVSNNVRCLLSPSASKRLRLVAYCNFENSLTCRLDKEVALVLVSAAEYQEPGVCGSGEEAASLITAVEHITKISKDQQKVLENSLALEAMSVLGVAEDDPEMPKRAANDPEYWAHPAKLQRMQSEPVTPVLRRQVPVGLPILC